MITEMQFEEVEVVGGGAGTGRKNPDLGTVIIVCPPPTFPIEVVAE